jgi:hypothetical protein
MLVGRVMAGAGVVLWTWPLALLVLLSATREISDDLLDQCRMDHRTHVGRWVSQCRLIRSGIVAAVAVVGLVVLGSPVPLHVAQIPTQAMAVWIGLTQDPNNPMHWLRGWPLLLIAAIGATVIAFKLTEPPATVEPARIAMRQRSAAAKFTVVAWVLSVQGELLRWKGDDAEAAKVLRRSLELASDDGYTRSLLAELELDAGRDEAVRALYTGRELNDSELLWVVLAKDETRRDELAGRVAANRQRGETLHRREESRYALRVEHDVTRALELAVANWAQQREVADARVLLEAAAAAKSKSAAAPGVAWLDATKLPMPALRALVKELSP